MSTSSLKSGKRRLGKLAPFHDLIREILADGGTVSIVVRVLASRHQLRVTPDAVRKYVAREGGVLKPAAEDGMLRYIQNSSNFAPATQPASVASPPAARIRTATRLTAKSKVTLSSPNTDKSPKVLAPQHLTSPIKAAPIPDASPLDQNVDFPPTIFDGLDRDDIEKWAVSRDRPFRGEKEGHLLPGNFSLEYVLWIRKILAEKLASQRTSATGLLEKFFNETRRLIPKTDPYWEKGEAVSAEPDPDVSFYFAMARRQCFWRYFGKGLLPISEEEIAEILKSQGDRPESLSVPEYLATLHQTRKILPPTYVIAKTRPEFQFT